MSEIRILHGNLDDEGDQIIIRGVIDQATLKFIGMAWYQREQGFSSQHTQEITDAYLAGTKVPDITLGMRGQRVGTHKNDTYVLRDKVYCIDGGQRLYAAAMAIRARPDLKISLGAKVYLGTDEDFENAMFCKLGTTQRRIAASVLFRNSKKKSNGARVVVELNKQEGFALRDRISWDQNRSRHELMTGYSFARIVGALHGHKAALASSKLSELLTGLDKLHDMIGEDSIKGNVTRFFEMVDSCWTIRNQTGNESKPHLKIGFLLPLARLMSNYPVFWDGKERNDFYFPQTYIRRLRTFKLADVIRSNLPIGSTLIYELLRKQLHLDPMTEIDPFEEAAE